MLVSDFDFELPPELIAQQPPAQRGDSRMLLLDRQTGTFQDSHFHTFASLLRPGDLVVMNDSRVIPARLYARREGLRTQHNSPSPTGRIEVLLAQPLGENRWRALVKPARKVSLGERLIFEAPNPPQPTLKTLSFRPGRSEVEKPLPPPLAAKLQPLLPSLAAKTLSFRPERSEVEKALSFPPERSEVEKPLPFRPEQSEVENSLSFRPERSEVENPLPFQPERGEVEKTLSFRPERSEVEKPAFLSATVTEEGEHGERILQFDPTEDFFATLDALGHIPLPPYIHRKEDTPEDRTRYQTVYAGADAHGSAAAPTAGLHFTPEALQQIQDRGAHIAYLTLHVGLGTFLPVRAEALQDIRLHEESYTLSATTASAIASAKEQGRRIIAVGTTTTRTLEHIAATAQLHAHTGTTAIFLQPGHTFRLVDALLTNFHLPKSTLLMLVSAFAGREHVLAAYAHAVDERYRFFSYGDCMFLS